MPHVFSCLIKLTVTGSMLELWCDQSRHSDKSACVAIPDQRHQPLALSVAWYGPSADKSMTRYIFLRSRHFTV